MRYNENAVDEFLKAIETFGSDIPLAIRQAAEALRPKPDGDGKTAYLPVRGDGEWWFEGCASNPQSAMWSVQAFEGCVEWSECERLGWSVIAVKVNAL